MAVPRTTQAFALSFGIALASGWIAGCSGDDPAEGQPSTPPSELTSEPMPPSHPASGSAGTSVAACVSACEAKYPKAAAKSRAIDSCWSDHCDACTSMPESKALFSPQAASCTTEVETPSAACSECTAQSCCAEWDACFGDADCLALNACSVACYH
jgi:hypothetical protein